MRKLFFSALLSLALLALAGVSSRAAETPETETGTLVVTAPAADVATAECTKDPVDLLALTAAPTAPVTTQDPEARSTESGTWIDYSQPCENRFQCQTMPGCFKGCDTTVGFCSYTCP